MRMTEREDLVERARPTCVAKEEKILGVKAWVSVMV